MSDTKTARVVRVLKIRPWEGPHGTVFYHELMLDNGDIGEVGKKKENAFAEGDIFGPYTAEESQYGVKFKEIKETPFGGGGGGKGGGKPFSDPRTMLCSYAKDITVAAIAQGLIVDNFFEFTVAGAMALNRWYEGDVPSPPDEEPVDYQFNGNRMEPAAPVPAYTGTIPATQHVNAPQTVPQYTPQPAQPEPRGKTKPKFGGIGEGGKPASTPQRSLLTKVAAEKGLNINQMIAEEWSDIQDSSELSSWATSYLLDKLFGNIA